MPQDPLTDPLYWRNRAEKARMRSCQMNDPANKLAMLKITEGQKRQAALLELLRDEPADDSHDC